MEETNPSSYYDIIQDKPNYIVGREKELQILVAVLLSGEHILLEGAPGTSKSTILRYVTDRLDLPLYQIEGSADLTPAKLIGTFNPNLVLEEGFKPEYFEPGPLFKAMNEGGVFYIDELNRAAPDATNALIRAMEEGEIVIPRYGKVESKPSFRVAAAMNPFDDTGVTRVSRALLDRLCRIKMEYQDQEEEIEIIKQNLNKDIPHSIMKMGTKIARATRFDDRLRQGSSVRGAVDFSNIAPNLAIIRDGYDSQVLLDAALAAFTGKIWLENPNLQEEEVIMEIVESVLRSLDKDFFDDLNTDLKKKTPKT